MEAIDAARKVSDAQTLCVIRVRVKENLTLAKEQIGGSRYDSRGTREDLKKIIKFIESGLETSTERHEVGAAGTTGATEKSGRDARMDTLLERIRWMIEEYARGA